MGNCKYSIDDWRADREGLDAGGTIRGVAEDTGVDRNAVFRWSREDGPPEWMWLSMKIEAPRAQTRPRRSPKARLTYEDRVIIFALQSEGKRPGETADAVGCHRTTVARELKRAPEGELEWLHLMGQFHEGLGNTRKEVPEWQTPSIPGSFPRSSSAR